MKKSSKRMALLLAGALLLSCTACNKSSDPDSQNQQDTQGQKKEFVWVPEFRSMEEDTRLYTAKELDQRLYYENYSWDETTMKSSYSIDSIALDDINNKTSVPIAMDTEEKTEDEKKQTNRGVIGFVPRKDGFVTCENIYHWNEETGESSSETFLCKYDLSGVRVFEADITDAMNQNSDGWASQMEMDGAGRIYLCADTNILLFDAEGKFEGVLKGDANSWCRGFYVDDQGVVFAAYDDRTSNSVILRGINFEGRSFDTTYKDCPAPMNDSGLSRGLSNTILATTSVSLYQYDCASQTAEVLFDWLDCDINGSYVNNVIALEEGKIACIVNDWNLNTCELAILTKKPAAEVKQKTEIVIAGMYAAYNEDTVDAAIQFNKKSDAYHVSIKNYFNNDDVVFNGDKSNYEEVLKDALNRLNNDLISGNCPDLLVLDGIDVERYASKGILEDLNPWLDNSVSIKRSDYFENILEASTYDGKLISITKSFEVVTLAGRKSELGERKGWTTSEMIAYGKEHPDAELLHSYTKSNALSLMLRYSGGSYLDWAEGKCNFDSDGFVSLLEFANQYPDEYQYDESAPSAPTKIATATCLLSEVNLYDFNGIQLYNEMFNKDISYIGFPNEKGESGSYLRGGDGIAMVAASGQKEGAWAFLENYLSIKNERNSFGFSSRKEDYEEAKAKAVKVEYRLDENGNPILDEDGKPMEIGGSASVGYEDGWTYEYHRPTEEEIAQLEAILKEAKAAKSIDETVMGIIEEEAGAFFSGQRSARDVAGIIQSRVQIYMNENK